jgi:hypothetical protein
MVVALVVALACAAPAVAQQMDHGDDGGMDHDSDRAAGILPPGDWTDQQIDDALDLVHRTEVDLQQFADFSTLTAKGYHYYGIDDGQWVHWINTSYLDDDHVLDPKFPEALVYRRLPGGVMQIEAAMFYLSTRYTLETIPADIAWLPGWHVHPELCNTDDIRFTGFASNGTCPSGHPATDRPMTHVWIVDNPCHRRFAELGIGIHCNGHADPPHLPPPSVPGTRPPGTRPPGTVPSPVPPEHRPPSPPATPVTAQPHYTG